MCRNRFISLKKSNNWSYGVTAIFFILVLTCTIEADEISLKKPDDVQNLNISTVNPKDNDLDVGDDPTSEAEDSTETESPTKKYLICFILFLCLLLVIMIITGFIIGRIIIKGRVLVEIHGEYAKAMGNFGKVIDIEQPPVTDENIKEAMELPIVKLKYQPSADTQLEYKMTADKNWEFPRKNVRFERIIGEGVFGAVVKAKAEGIVEKGVTTTVSIKMLKAQHSDTDMINLVIEMEVMKMIGKHKNILGLLGCCTQGGPLWVLVEYVALGNLREFLIQNHPLSEDKSNKDVNLKEMPEIVLTEKTLLSFASQVASGMEYLSSKKYIHRDLAARNILVTEDLVMKISDFGLSRDIHENDYYKKLTGCTLPLKWMAPESLSRGEFTVKTDIWSFGVLLYEMMTFGGTPYASIPNDTTVLFKLLRGGCRMEKPGHCSEDIYDVMRDCWKYLPNDRPKFADLVEILDDLSMKR